MALEMLKLTLTECLKNIEELENLIDVRNRIHAKYFGTEEDRHRGYPMMTNLVIEIRKLRVEIPRTDLVPAEVIHLILDRIDVLLREIPQTLKSFSEVNFTHLDEGKESSC